MLNTAASFLNGEAQALASLRDALNSSCHAARNAFGTGSASAAFNDFFEAWFSAFDAQAETMGSVADATQQCAVIYDHVDRHIAGYIAAMPTQPPPSPPSKKPDNPFGIFFPNPNPPMA
ncbi:MAG: WXG100 family type VII secretion target [Micromonosporaceae bacterium]|nr:WXG100 family type VII secretion target [Micromonosporaceae bacterium]